MKNKATTYLLLTAVLLVWGVIGYRFFSAMDTEEYIPANIQQDVRKGPAEDFTMKVDTTRLELNYRDPFTEATEKDINVIPVAQLVAAIPTAPRQPKPMMNWAFIQYVGYIKNPDTKKLIAMVNINGRSAMLTEGETVEKVQLLKNLKDSIKVKFEEKVKFITMNQ